MVNLALSNKLLGVPATNRLAGKPQISHIFTGNSQFARKRSQGIKTQALQSETVVTLVKNGEEVVRSLVPLVFLADLDPGTAVTLQYILGPVISGLNFLFILRIVMSWYPQLPAKELPYSIAFIPTEPILGPTRKLIKPIGGVDVAPVIWVAIMSFINEILLGSQGLLVLLANKQPY